MNTKNANLLFLVLFWVCFSQNALADKLLFDFVEQTQFIERPVLGQSMEDVLSFYGEPDTRIDATGRPPITRWIYPVFTVYFENETVIHSVVNPDEAAVLTMDPELTP